MPANLQESWIQSLSAMTFLVLGVAGCSPTNFSGNATTVKQADLISIQGTDTKTIAQPIPVKNGTIDVQFSAGGDDKATDEKALRPLTVYFVLDVTASMQPNITAIKLNIGSFISALKSNGFDPRIGMVTFSDTIQGTFALSPDVNSFIRFMDRLLADGGDGANEGSLLAIEEALKRVQAEDRNPESLKTILLVTDNPGHRGGDGNANSTPGNCQVEPTVAAFNALSANEQQRVKIYYSVSAFVPRVVAPCSGFQDAKEQMARLMAGIFPGQASSDKGGELKWPFTGDTLIKEFIGKLEKTVPGQAMICLATQADVRQGGVVRAKWQSQSIQEVFDAFKEGDPLSIKSAIAPEDLPNFTQQGGVMHVHRCCIRRDKAEAGVLDACDLERDQVVDFKLEVVNP